MDHAEVRSTDAAHDKIVAELSSDMSTLQVGGLDGVGSVFRSRYFHDPLVMWLLDRYETSVLDREPAKDGIELKPWTV